MPPPQRKARSTSCLEAGRSRIPVLGEGIDNVEGVLYARELLQLMDEGGDEATLVRDLMRPAYFVPETKKVSELLREMQASQVHLAIVVDEFGGTAGLVHHRGPARGARR